MAKFTIGDIVTVRGSNIEGEVIEVGYIDWRAGKVCVRRPGSWGSGHMTHWIKVGKVTLVRAADDGDAMAEDGG